MTDGGGAAELLPVFVYGLLKPGFSGHRELGLDTRTDWMGEDALPGTLYDLGDYPGAVLGGGGTIHGMLLRPHDAGVIDDLDRYEGFSPSDHIGSDYVRVRATTLRHGLNVWIYAYNLPVIGAPALSDGEWPER